MSIIFFCLLSPPDERWWAGSVVGDAAGACCHPRSHPQLPAEPAPAKEAALQTLRSDTKRNEKGNTNMSHFHMKRKLAAPLNLIQLEQGSERGRRSSRSRVGLRDEPQTGHEQLGLRGSTNLPSVVRPQPGDGPALLPPAQVTGG